VVAPRDLVSRQRFSHHAQAVLFVNDKLAEGAGVWIQADDNPVAPGAPHTVGAAAGPEV